jgi:hypothetical protein
MRGFECAMFRVITSRARSEHRIERREERAVSAKQRGRSEQRREIS